MATMEAKLRIVKRKDPDWTERSFTSETEYHNFEVTTFPSVGYDGYTGRPAVDVHIIDHKAVFGIDQTLVLEDAEELYALLGAAIKYAREVR